MFGTLTFLEQSQARNLKEGLPSMYVIICQSVVSIERHLDFSGLLRPFSTLHPNNP